MVIGTASLILVVTISLTGKQCLLDQIQAIGSNMIYAEHQSGSGRITGTTHDPLTLEDMKAAQAEVPGIIAGSPVIDLSDRIPVGGGRERDVHILAVYPEYRTARNLVVVSGRFFDAHDQRAHTKAAVVRDKMAGELYGSPMEAVGKVIKIADLPFTIIGTFKERIDTFGQSEVTDNTMVIPYTVGRYFTDTPSVKQLYFSVADSTMVVSATDNIRRVITARHRPASSYSVQNLAQLVSLAEKVTTC